MNTIMNIKLKKMFVGLGFFALLITNYYLLITSYAAAPAPLYPGDLPQAPITKLQNILDPTTKTGTLPTLVGWLIGVFWIMAIGFVVWAAFTFLFADGDENEIGDAKNRLKYALIAAMVAALSTGIDVIVYYLLRGNIY